MRIVMRFLVLSLCAGCADNGQYTQQTDGMEASTIMLPECARKKWPGAEVPPAAGEVVMAPDGSVTGDHRALAEKVRKQSAQPKGLRQDEPYAIRCRIDRRASMASFYEHVWGKLVGEGTWLAVQCRDDRSFAVPAQTSGGDTLRNTQGMGRLEVRQGGFSAAPPDQKPVRHEAPDDLLEAVRAAAAWADSQAPATWVVQIHVPAHDAFGKTVDLLAPLIDRVVPRSRLSMQRRADQILLELVIKTSG